jgi:hypothetical protein
MARPRTPIMKAHITGASLHDPARYAGRMMTAGGSIGQPPECMTSAQAEAWQEFTVELPWLNSSHRAVLQIAAVLRARLNSDPDMGVAAMQAYSAVLSKLGATPADESRVAMPDLAEDDPAERFFRH